MLERWLSELATTLGVEDDVDVDGLLDVAREVAHGVERRAAPLTTYLIGVAAAKTGLPVDELNRKTLEAARGFQAS